jgi:hypothetical protein
MTDIITVNYGFTDKSRKIKIPLLAAKINDEEAEATKKSVEEDRKHAIEAAVVRIMKSRKTMDHQRLVLEVSQQLTSHFRPDPRQIKKRIEDLISREYIERSAEKANVYQYLA